MTVWAKWEENIANA